MKRLINWVVDNILYLYTLFLLAFIPLYPKLPLVDIKNTWVYIRFDDVAVVFAILLWVFMFLRGKVKLKTPITIPIMAFWIIGAIATIHGVVLIFPTLANVFPNVAFLTYARHIEYLFLFFVAFAGMRDKRYLTPTVIVLALTLIGVVIYGFGQKYLEFPAYLTMNEQYAKGIPIILSQLSRVPSTFAGQYDLAAYLVLIIPIIVSMIFGFRNWFVKAALGVSAVLGFALLFLTVSRVSFFVVIVGLFALLFFHKKKFVIYALPVLALLALIVFAFSPALLSRFGNTVKKVDVLVDGKTGSAVGEVTFVPVDNFKDKLIKEERVSVRSDVDAAVTGGQVSSTASISGALDFKLLEGLGSVPLVTAANVSNGESLPQGTGYINLSLAPVVKRVGNFFYELSPNIASTSSAQVLIIDGDFIIKRASAYDLSFTTRFQGEWPHALEAFARNVLVGSGYGSVSLAVDNNYLRMLGETGLLGTIAFFVIFLATSIYIVKILPDVDSPAAKSFILGFAAGVIGLALNATLIDVFEASKIAYLLWMLTGITLGLLVLYQKDKINLMRELRSAASSTWAIVIYIFALTFVIFSPMLGNYFVGDDFTWFRWAADCTMISCSSAFSTILSYFTTSGGFFWRPGTKTFFYLMYHTVWLNQVVYHGVSVFLHATVAVLFFLLAKKIFKKPMLAAGAAFLFLILSGYSEEVFWIAATGHLFSAVFALLALLLFTEWREKKNSIYYILSIISMCAGLLFYETVIIVPLLMILYVAVFEEGFDLRSIYKKGEYMFLFVPEAIYLIVRYLAGSHWQGGDYSYSILHLPFNLIGNTLGYIVLTIAGSISLAPYEKFRDITRTHLPITAVLAIVVIAIGFWLYKNYHKKIKIAKEDRKILTFGFLFFIIAALPFLDLGNITSRYDYLPSIGLVLVFIVLLSKLYEFLKESGKDIATYSIVTIIVVFSLLQIVQLEQLHLDWNSAGGQAQNFLIAIDDYYSDYWSTGPLELHFVNVPTKVGQAWVWPVGLQDALWFTFNNPKAQIIFNSTTQEALDQVGTITPTKKIFIFQGDGSVIEMQPPKAVVPTPTVEPVAPVVPMLTPVSKLSPEKVR